MPIRNRDLVGSVRTSQLLHTYGVGSLVDLPNISVVVLGLQAWQNPATEIDEPRLLAKVRSDLGDQVVRLVAMPWVEGSNWGLDESTRVGVPVAPFPRWLRCTGCNTIADIDVLFKLKTDPYRPEKARFVHEGCRAGKNPPSAVPARFVLACTNGHLDDFPWYEHVHAYAPCPSGGGTLMLRENGTGTRSTELSIECKACGKHRSLSDVFDPKATSAPKCRGYHPHLRIFEECGLPAKTLLLGASNTWFGVIRRALWVPEVNASDDLTQAVEEHWSHLDIADIVDVDTLSQALRFNPRLAPLRAYEISDLWSAISGRKGPASEVLGDEDLKLEEWRRFTDHSKAHVGVDFTIASSGVPLAYADRIAEVVAASRLRETAAIVGFARVDAPDPSFAGLEEDEAIKVVSLSSATIAWVPATTARGEGIFVRFPEERLAMWEVTASKAHRIQALRAATVRRFSADAWPGARYVFLHSFAHLLINELALECGYNAASLRERLYSDIPGADEPMAGVLIYTAASDSEGTLGGLVAMAEPGVLGRVLDSALQRAAFCSSDPLCAEHLPTEQDGTQHGAACHSCLFVPETSCERNNRLLDRATLVDTIGSSAIGYFR
jgi:hypothetical protein